MGTVPSESSQVLWQPSITALVPRLKRRRQAPAWLHQSPSRTGKTWQKSPLPVTFIPTLSVAYSHPSTSLDTQMEEERVVFLRQKPSVRIRHSAWCIMGWRTSQRFGALAVLTVGWPWTVAASLRPWAQAHSSLICRQIQTINDSVSWRTPPPFPPPSWIIHSLAQASTGPLENKEWFWICSSHS